MNEGKKFENAFKNSVPSSIFYYKLPDPAESFSAIKEGLRFTRTNPCDSFMFDPEAKTLYALELKSTKGTSITYWREDFEKSTKSNTFMVRKNQILGLQDIGKYSIVAGFIYNFRSTNRTYYQSIDDFLVMTKHSVKKSFNESDVINNSGVLIDQQLMRTNYKYDIKKFIQMVHI